MEYRPATSSDGDAIREIALRSLEASYTLSPQTIEGAVKQWYDDEAFEKKLSDDDYVVLVAERDDELVGFAEGDVVAEGGDGDLLWLHVDPDYRGEGIGNGLFESIHARLIEMGADRLRGRVLRDNPDGNDFYEQHGFVQAGDARIDIDGTNYVENIYVESDPSEMESVSTDDGQELFVDYDESERGSVAPFLVAYADPERNQRYGYYCSNCGSLDTAADTMGRVECNDCGNLRKATRWDSAYL